jgi:hypothetical protein
MEFSFDSFLDVVANVVGIIIRLILVVWVGARSYTAAMNKQPGLPEEPTPRAAAAAEPPSPLSREVARRQAELEELETRLAEQAARLGLLRREDTQTVEQVAALATRRQELAKARADLERDLTAKGTVGQEAIMSAEEFRRRCDRLAVEIRDLEKEPPAKKTLRYQTPVSKPVQSDELMFECSAGRVTFIDIAVLLAEVKQDMEEKSKALRNQWEVMDVAGPVGAFRLRYTVERERGLVDGALGGATPDSHAGFRAGISAWQLEPIAATRGEAVDRAMAVGSEFRRIADTIDPQQTTVTFWVYPDSFALYRSLRDYLHERDVVVAGRPIPLGSPMGASRSGSLSRGQ